MEEHHRSWPRAIAGAVDNPLSQSSPSPAPPPGGTGILRLHGSRVYASSSILVRARLGDDAAAPRIRAAVALFAEICDSARAERGAESLWWTSPVEVCVESSADAALLSLTEAETAFTDLVAAGLLMPAERGYRIEADALCECPALSHFDLGAARERLRGQSQLAGPATVLLREIARLADERGTASTTIPTSGGRGALRTHSADAGPFHVGASGSGGAS